MIVEPSTRIRHFGLKEFGLPSYDQMRVTADFNRHETGLLCI